VYPDTHLASYVW